MQLELLCKAVCFDFDGVIVDSMPYHLAAWNRAHNLVFRQPIPDDVLNSLIGYSTKAISQKLCQRLGKLAAREKLAAAKMQELNARPETLPLLDGFTALVNALEQAKIPWSIVSNSPRSFVEAVLSAHRIAAPFILGIEDVKRPKPEPDPYLQALRKIGLSYPEHSEALVFEDSTHGIAAAIAAKARAIGITSSQPRATLLAAGARACFTNLQEFYDSELCRAVGILKAD